MKKRNLVSLILAVILLTGLASSAFAEEPWAGKRLGVAHITLIEIMPRFFAAATTQEALLGSGKAEGHTETRVVDLEVAGDRLVAVLLENAASGKTWREEADGVFVFLGQRPSNELFKDQVTLTKAGYVPATPDMATMM